MTQVNLILAIILLCLAGCAESGTPLIPSATAPAALLPASTTTLAPSPTLEPATATSPPEPSPTPTATATPPASPTSPPTPTSPPLPTATLIPTVALAANPTPASTPTPDLTAECAVLPAGSFLTIWQSQFNIQTGLGCPTDVHPRITPQAWPIQTSHQSFEQGEMLWSDHIAWYAQPVIYVIYADGNYERFDDTFDPATDPTGGETVDGRVEPALGFGKVWREQPGVQERLGWPTAPEEAGEGYFQMFGGGEMIWLSQTGQTYVFIRAGSTVETFEEPFSLK